MTNTALRLLVTIISSFFIVSNIHAAADEDCLCESEFLIETIDNPTLETFNLDQLDDLFQRSAESGIRWQDGNSHASQAMEDYLIKRETLQSRLRYDAKKKAFIVRNREGQIIGFALVSTFKTWAQGFRFSEEPEFNIPESYVQNSYSPDAFFPEHETLEELVIPNVMELSILVSDGSVRGVGSALLSYVMRSASQEGYEFVILESKVPVIGFYKKYGFKIINLLSKQKHIVNRKHKIVLAPYVHWAYPNEIIGKKERENPPTMMLAPIVKPSEPANKASKKRKYEENNLNPSKKGNHKFEFKIILG